ncbi:hypothetical protein M9458_012613, partial [Cirrhinus mrigala]
IPSPRHTASCQPPHYIVGKQSLAISETASDRSLLLIPEKFHFDDREVLLHHLNLSPARWTPDLTSQTHTHTPVACTGYFTLTILGLNQTAAVDVLFVPAVSLDDPRAAGVPHTQHDNSLL